MKKIFFYCVLLSGALLTSCSFFTDAQSEVTPEIILTPRSDDLTCQQFMENPNNNPEASTPALDKTAHLQWLNKTSRFLRGKSLSKKDDIETLLKTPRADVVKLWMRDVAFLDTALSFGTYMWGMKKDSIRNPDRTFNYILKSTRTAILSAQALAKNEDYLKALFTLYPPFYILSPPTPMPEISFPEDKDKTPVELLKAFKERNLADIQKAIENYEKEPPKTQQELCDKTIAPTVSPEHISRLAFYSGSSEFLNGQISFQEDWANGFNCIGISTADMPPENPVPILKSMARKEALFFDSLIQLLSYKAPTKIEDIAAFNPAEFGVENTKFSAFDGELISSLINSSTNMNRKRGSFILQRFFCDDLTPINVEAPASHAGGQHGTETSCRACHYKLDPMAGFFANHGIIFDDFSKDKVDRLIFDDLAQTKLSEYVQNWFNQELKVWDIGYVRSATDRNLNTYGRDLNDLFKIIQEAPEVKACLTKRLYEYFISPEQMMDAGFMDYASQEFMCASKQNSSEAFKRSVTRVLLSQSFAEKNPVSDKCYDYAPGFNPEGAPPCQVAAVLQKNCVGCHHSTTGNGRLNLSKWIQLENGDFNFPHLNRKGEQVSQLNTFAAIEESLSTSDESARMPKDKYMHPLDREKLYLWVQKALGSQK